MKQKGTSKGGEAQERECDQISWAVRSLFGLR